MECLGSSGVCDEGLRMIKEGQGVCVYKDGDGTICRVLILEF